MFKYIVYFPLANTKHQMQQPPELTYLDLAVLETPVSGPPSPMAWPSCTAWPHLVTMTRRSSPPGWTEGRSSSGRRSYWWAGPRPIGWPGRLRHRRHHLAAAPAVAGIFPARAAFCAMEGKLISIRARLLVRWKRSFHFGHVEFSSKG